MYILGAMTSDSKVTSKMMVREILEREAAMAHIRQSRPDSGFQVKILKNCEVVPFWLDKGPDDPGVSGLPPELGGGGRDQTWKVDMRLPGKGSNTAS